jgi:CheY-like chemotaxis protein
MASKPILIVDDDKEVRSALAELLEGEGYTVAGAANGNVALQLMRGGLHPAIILLDLMMPEMDGWDFRSEQERDPTFARVPVVIVSASGFSHESIRTQFRPAAYFPKPLERSKLLDVIERLVVRSEGSSGAPGELETADRAGEPQDDGA